MLQYTSKDVMTMIDCFASIYDKKDNLLSALKEIETLKKYPTEVLSEFLDCMTTCKITDDNIKENYMGVIGYITLKLNLRLMSKNQTSYENT